MYLTGVHAVFMRYNHFDKASQKIMNPTFSGTLGENVWLLHSVPEHILQSVYLRARGS